METLITAIQIISAFLLVGAVLLQPSKGGSFMTASSQNSHMSNAPTSFLFKLTMCMAATLMITCLYLSRSAIESSKKSVTDLNLPAVPALPSQNEEAPPAQPTGN